MLRYSNPSNVTDGGALELLGATGVTTAVVGGTTYLFVAGQTDALRRVPGVGQKTAERLVLELRDKVTPPPDDGAPPAPAARETKDDEVIAALVGLGYTQSEATSAASPVNGAERPLEDRIREALRALAK